MSVLSVSGEINRNWTEHGLSWLTVISDAGSTPAASTIYFNNLHWVWRLQSMLQFPASKFALTRSAFPQRIDERQ